MTRSIDDDLRWLLEAAAPADTHLDDGWRDLSARLGGHHDAPAPRVADRRRPWLAVAAAIVVVGAVVAAITWARAGRDEPDVVAPPPAAATGWYIPVGLDGWVLDEVNSDWRDLGEAGSCPCTVSVLSGGEASTATVFRASSDGRSIEEVFPGGTPVEVGGIDARRSSGDGTSSWGWIVDGGYTSIVFVGVPEEEQPALAAAVAGRRGPPVSMPGFDVLVEGRVDGGARAFHAVQVVLRNERTDATLSYVLTPPGTGSLYGMGFAGALELVRLPGQPRELLHAPPPADGGYSQPSYGGAWPGADIAADGDGGFGLTVEAAPEADLEAVLASLRPATGDEWRQFLATARGPVDGDPDLRVDRLDDLVVDD